MSWVNLLDVVYPIGSIYCSNSSTSPADIIGGTWTQIENAVLRGTTDSVGYVGSDTHAITSNEMPSHNHSASTNSAGAHSHDMNLAGDDGNTLSGSTHTYVYKTTTASTTKTDSAGAHTHTVTIGKTGGGSNVSRSTILQLLYLVQNRLENIIEVTAYVMG